MHMGYIRSHAKHEAMEDIYKGVKHHFVTIHVIPRPVHWRTIPVTYEQ